VDGFWNVKGVTCIRDISTQIQNLLQEDDVEEDDDNIEEDTTLQLYFLQETVRRLCNVGQFNQNDENIGQHLYLNHRSR
jgi:hypothetical protein